MNDYYVYVHKRLDDLMVFYVGKGNERSKRAFRTDRSNLWKRVAQEAGGFLVEFIKKGLTESEAFTLEKVLIQNPKSDWRLVNKFLPIKIKTLPPDMGDYVYYDETSPSCIRWKRDIGYKIKKDSCAGSLNKKGYWVVEISGVPYQVHRVVLFLHHKLDDSLFVNHINNIRSDNKLSNLEIITCRDNNRRTIHHNLGTTRPNNNSGFNGITKRMCVKSPRFVAEWYDENGKKKSKSFAIAKYGEEQALILAMEFRKSKLNSIGNKDDKS